MNRRDFLTLAGATATASAWPLAGLAQVPAKVPRVALVSGAVPVVEMRVGRDDFRSGLIQELEKQGFVEGRTVILERYTLPGQAVDVTQNNARLVLNSSPDLIFWMGATPSALAAMGMNKTLPMIVETGDVLGQGVVTNLAHPGGNVTGISASAGPETEGKLLSLLAEAVPDARIFAYANAGSDGQFGQIKQGYVSSVMAVASKLGLTMVPIVYAAGGGAAEFQKVFTTSKAAGADMIVFGTDTPLSVADQQRLVADLASANRLPAAATNVGFAAMGGLLGWGANRDDLGRLSATHISLVLSGARPGNLPVLQPTVFDFVINLKTAKAIGVTIPATLLAQATEVIQ